MTHVTDKQLGKTYPLFVDYRISVEEALEFDPYGSVGSDITSENFPTEQTGTVDIVVELIHFDCRISIDEALDKFNSMGLRPVNLHGLLAFGGKYPGVQIEFPVVALGSVWQDRDGNRVAPTLEWVGLERCLELHLIGEEDWHEVFRFAVVRN